MFFLQQYWWAVVSLLGALLVLMLFVQGGQMFLFRLPKNDSERSLIVNALGHKWELTFTTLVTFGGAAFASFPLFYSTSFGGAYWLWMAILFFFVIQAVSYEFRTKAGNWLGQQTYEWWLFLNGLCGTFLLGVAVAMFFSGAPFTMDKGNITQLAQPVISQWASAWHGLELLVQPFNILLGLVLVFAARTLGLLFLATRIDDVPMVAHMQKSVRINAPVFVLLFVVFVGWLLLRTGYAVNPVSGVISVEPYKYLHNFLAVPWISVLLLVGVVLVLTGLFKACVHAKLTKATFWITGTGVVLAVWSVLLCAAFNNTAYLVSTVDPQYSLTLYNSSSSAFTLKVMAYVSILVPFVLLYIAYVWRAMGRTKLNSDNLTEKEEITY